MPRVAEVIGVLAGPEQVLDYVGRYTHRIAISNNRLHRVSMSRQMIGRGEDRIPSVTRDKPVEASTEPCRIHHLQDPCRRAREIDRNAVSDCKSVCPSGKNAPFLVQVVDDLSRSDLLRLAGIDKQYVRAGDLLRSEG